MAVVSNAAALAALNAVVDRLDLGSGTASAHMLIYSGTPPADVDTALSGNTLLADLVMSNAAFGSATDAAPGATVAAAAITSDASADATGTATFCRLVDRDGTAVIQLTVTASGGGGQVIISSTSIVATGTVACSALTITLAE